MTTPATNPASEVAVHVVAAKHGANPAALCDSAQFMATVDGLDPTSPGFVTAVDRAVREAVAVNPRYRAPTPLPTTPQPPRQWTLEDVQDASNPAEVVKALNEGLLRDLGYGPKRRRR